MKLAELYAQTPVVQHANIKLAGDRVFVRDADGYVDEYADINGELWLLRSERKLAGDIEAIRSKLGI